MADKIPEKAPPPKQSALAAVTPSNPFRIAGFEKFWVALLGGTMSAAVTTLVLWALSSTTSSALIPPPESAAVVGAISGVIGTIFTATLVYLTATTTPEDSPAPEPQTNPVEHEK
jgi:hypothetical protein